MQNGAFIHRDHRTVNEVAVSWNEELTLLGESTHTKAALSASKVLIIQCWPAVWPITPDSPHKLWDGSWLPPNSEQLKCSGTWLNTRVKEAGAAAVARCGATALACFIGNLLEALPIVDAADQSPYAPPAASYASQLCSTHLPSWSLFHGLSGCSTIMEHLTEFGDIRLTNFGAFVANLAVHPGNEVGIVPYLSEAILQSILSNKPEHEELEEKAQLAFSVMGVPWSVFESGLISAVRNYKLGTAALTNAQLHSYDRISRVLGCAASNGPLVNLMTVARKDFIKITARKVIAKQSAPTRYLSLGPHSECGSTIQSTAPFLLLSCIASLQGAEASGPPDLLSAPQLCDLCPLDRHLVVGITAIPLLLSSLLLVYVLYNKFRVSSSTIAQVHVRLLTPPLWIRVEIGCKETFLNNLSSQLNIPAEFMEIWEHSANVFHVRLKGRLRGGASGSERPSRSRPPSPAPLPPLRAGRRPAAPTYTGTTDRWPNTWGSAQPLTHLLRCVITFYPSNRGKLATTNKLTTSPPKVPDFCKLSTFKMRRN